MFYSSLRVVLVALVAVVGGVIGLVSLAGPGPEALTATAAGSTAGMTVGLVVAGFAVHRRFGTFWPWLSVLRVALAAGVAIALGRLVLPFAGKLITLGECVAVLVVYFAVLALLREFTGEDVKRLKTVLRRG